MDRIIPLKRFGQNYLQDQNIIRKIVDEICPAFDDKIIEIGPGKGALTEKLLQKNSDLTAVEIDRRVIEDLSERFGELELIEGDFLELDLRRFAGKDGKRIRIVGNIPYNITSPILFKLFENNIILKDAVFMVQFEVAKRMTANIGSKDYGILSVLLNYFGRTELAFKVSRNVFYPKPNVDSALVHIYYSENRSNSDFNTAFISVVKAAFGNRRKTLKNSLGNSIFAKVDFSGCGIDLSLRAEQLSVRDFIELAEFAFKK